MALGEAARAGNRVRQLLWEKGVNVSTMCLSSRKEGIHLGTK